MTFFPNSSGVNIYGGKFTSFNYQMEDAGRSIQVFLSKYIDDTVYSQNRWAYGSVSMGNHLQASILFVLLLQILNADDVELRRELISDDDNSYRIHAASHRGRLVAVKMFEGPRAKQVSAFYAYF